MTEQAPNVQFSVKSWAEVTYDGRIARDVTGAKATVSDIVYIYKGAIVGEGTLKYLMHYRETGTVVYTGLEVIMGSVDGREGGFTFLHTGIVDEAGVVIGTLEIIPGSGHGGLTSISGNATIRIIGHQESYPMEFTYSFDQ